VKGRRRIAEGMFKVEGRLLKAERLLNVEDGVRSRPPFDLTSAIRLHPSAMNAPSAISLLQFT
jgi:hypothetical protein